MAGSEGTRSVAEEDGYTPLRNKRARPVTDRARHVRVAEMGASARSLGVAAIIVGQVDGHGDGLDQVVGRRRDHCLVAVGDGYTTRQGMCWC
jgi:hypothetical protein